jgi:glycosyltransferase involved in cell wall biosynthesis
MILESLLCGTPVIAYNIGLAPDAIQHEQNGFIYPLHGPGDLSDGMLKLIRASGEDYQGFCRNARTFAAEQFSHKREIQAYLDLFKKITKNHV